MRIANQEMVRALRVVTVERGVDPRRFALLPFGGAGPMHAAAIAAELGIERILCPRAGGVLSALGLCASDRRRDTARTVMLAGEELSRERIAAEVDELIAGLAGEGLEGAEPEVVYEMRYAGQAFELPVPGPPDADPADLVERFEHAHEALYGHRDPEGERASSSTSAWRWSPPARARIPAAAARRPARGGLAPRPLRRRVGEHARPARRARRGHRGEGPGRLRAARGDLRRPARLVGARRRGRHDRGGGAMAERSTRSRCRCSPAACAPPARRWARR